MNKEDLIRKNQEAFSDLRKWAMERKYVATPEHSGGMGGIVLAGIAGSAVAANASAIPNGTVGVGASGLGAAIALKIGSTAAVFAHKTNFHKLPVQAFYRLSDSAKIVFQRTIDRMMKVPLDLTKARELSEGLARMKFQAQTMLGVAVGAKDRYVPETNIYMPDSKLDADSPLYAKNRQIYNEIIFLKDKGVLNKEDLADLDEYTKGITDFSTDKTDYNKMVNYAVLVPKVEALFEKTCAIQEGRESLKIDTAKSIERAILKEEKGRLAPTSMSEMNEELNERIAGINEKIDAMPEQPVEDKKFSDMSREEYESHFSKINEIAAGAPEGTSLKDAAAAVSENKASGPKIG